MRLLKGGSSRSERLGDLLLQAGAITKDQLSAALAMQARSGGRVGSNLVELGAVDERTLAHVLAQQLNIPSASAAQLDQPGQAAIERVTRALAERHRAVPLRIDGQRLWVALADPTDREALRALERESGMEVRAMVAPDVLIDFALGKHYGVRRRTRVLEVRDAQLLEVDAIEELPTYEPHVEHEADDDTIAAPMKLGFLDERPAPAKAPPGPRLSSLEGVRARLMAASTDEAVFEILLEALRDAAARFAILLLRGGVLVAHRGQGLDTRSLALIRLPLADAPALARLLDGNAPYFGPLPAELGSFFQAAGAPNGLVLPLSMGRKSIGAIVGGQVPRELAARSEELKRIAEMVDLALHIGHLRARLLRV